jgi:hypothetical protein
MSDGDMYSKLPTILFSYVNYNKQQCHEQQQQRPKCYNPTHGKRDHMYCIYYQKVLIYYQKVLIYYQKVLIYYQKVLIY